MSNLMEVQVTGRGAGHGCEVRLGETRLTAERGAVDCIGAAHVAIRPERVHIEPAPGRHLSPTRR